MGRGDVRDLVTPAVAVVLIQGGIVGGVGVLIHTGVPGEGEHAGYVTSVECGGLIWVTCTAHVKSSLESTQEDAYCVDPTLSGHAELLRQLRELAESRRPVVVHHRTEFWMGPSECYAKEPAKIVRVTEAAS